MLLCDEVRVPEMIISDKIESIQRHWFHTDRPFNYSDTIELSTFNAVRSKLQLEKFLKRLHFQGSYEDYKQLKLNNFTQLEELTIDVRHPLRFFTLEDNAIRLPNLKILDIAGYKLSRYFNDDLVLATPKLETLKCDKISLISLAHPETIEHLEVSGDDGLTGEITQSFPNLRYLKFDRNVPEDVDILSKHPKLETFTLLCNHYKLLYFSRAMLRHFLEQKRILRRHELRIYCKSVEMAHAGKINECGSTESILEFQMNNFDTLCDNIHFCDSSTFNYNELMGLVKGRSLPDDFFHKFRNIKRVKVSGEVDQARLLQFLKRLKYLRTLRLTDAILDQRFFDALPEFSGLTELFMRNATTLNYDFVLKLKLLEIFITDQYSPELYDLSLALFKERKYFSAIEFLDGNKSIVICRNTLHPNDYMVWREEDQMRLEEPYNNKRIDFEVLSRLVNEHKTAAMLCTFTSLKQEEEKLGDI